MWVIDRVTFAINRFCRKPNTYDNITHTYNMQLTLVVPVGVDHQTDALLSPTRSYYTAVLCRCGFCNAPYMQRNNDGQPPPTEHSLCTRSALFPKKLQPDLIQLRVHQGATQSALSLHAHGSTNRRRVITVFRKGAILTALHARRAVLERVRSSHHHHQSSGLVP